MRNEGESSLGMNTLEGFVRFVMSSLYPILVLFLSRQSLGPLGATGLRSCWIIADSGNGLYSLLHVPFSNYIYGLLVISRMDI